MADPTEVALTILRWIVASLVTLGGVLVAHRQQARARQAEEDLDNIYRPLHREMEGILATEPEQHYFVFTKVGGNAMFGWVPTETFKVIWAQGMLEEARHERLRRDVGRLLELNVTLDAARLKFQTSLNGTTILVYRVFQPGPDKELILADVLGENYYNQTLYLALAAGDKDGWVQEFNRVLMNKKVNQLKSSETIYKELDEAVEGARQAFQEAAKDLWNQVKGIRLGLKECMRKGKPYT